MRVAWGLSRSTIFYWSPRPLWFFRCWILRLFGAKIGGSVHIHNTARICYPWLLQIGDHSAIGEYALIYNLGKVEIGKFVTISQYSHLCAGSHDYSTREMRLIRATITVHDDAWICTNALVGPGVTVGQGAIVGAGSVAMRDISPWTIVSGNPAAPFKRRDPLVDSVSYSSN